MIFLKIFLYIHVPMGISKINSIKFGAYQTRIGADVIKLRFSENSPRG